MFWGFLVVVGVVGVVVRLKFEFGAFYLQSKPFTTGAIPPVHFAVVILEMGIS
jgi:hypothetical protein